RDAGGCRAHSAAVLAGAASLPRARRDRGALRRVSLSRICHGCLSSAGLGAWVVVLVSSLLFSLAHSYQGTGGMVMTLVVGWLLGASRLAYNSLVPAVFWHASVDVVAGVAGRRYLGRNTT